MAEVSNGKVIANTKSPGKYYMGQYNGGFYFGEKEKAIQFTEDEAKTKKNQLEDAGYTCHLEN